MFHFKALPFGISSAPWLFTMIFTQLAVILRRKFLPFTHSGQGRSLSSTGKKNYSCANSSIRTNQNWPHSVTELCGNPVQPPGGHGLTCNRKNGQTPDESLLLSPQPIGSRTGMGTFEPAGGMCSMRENLCPSYSTKHPSVRQSTKRFPWPSNPGMEGEREAIQWWMDEENFFKGCPIHQPTY